MKTWQKGCLATLAILIVGIISSGLYLIYVTEASFPKPGSPDEYQSIPTLRPTNTTIPSCDKPTVSAWINGLEARQNELNSDMDIVLIVQSPNPDDYISLAIRAKARYDTQILEQTPECLSSLQTLMTDAFYYFWQGMVSITRGDWGEGASYIQLMTDKLEIAEGAINAAIELTE